MNLPPSYMKKTPSLNKFNHSVAAYPEEYLTSVVTDGKICIQFKHTQLKTRINKDHIEQLKKGPQHTREIPINTIGTDIDVLAVGIPIELHKIFQLELLKAYNKYIVEFDPTFKEFLQEYHKELGKLLDN